MDALITALTITAFIMMGSTLFVMIWEMLDNKKPINIKEETIDRVKEYLATDDKSKIEEFVDLSILQLIHIDEYNIKEEN